MNNHIVVAGHLGSDPETRFTSSGQKVTSFRLASNSRRGGNTETTWWRITVWGETLDKLISYLKKGSAVIVMGELQKPEIFTGRDGTSQVSLNIVAVNLSFSPFGKGDRQTTETQSSSALAQTEMKVESSARGMDPSTPDTFIEDEIPF